MTRADDYAEGYSSGWLWAEADIRDGSGSWWEAEVRADAREGGVMRAFWLGAARGYRECFRRYDAGTHTRSMFELSRLNR